MPTQNPYLFIVAGPTGSGKGSLPKKIKSYLGINDNNSAEKILIDDIIEKQESYKIFVNDLVEEYCDGQDILCDNLKLQLENPSSKILKEFSDAYYNARKNICCDCDTQPCEPCKSCDTMNDNKLINALKNKKDIIFETTGTYYPSWFFTWPAVAKPLKENKYEVIMAWTVANWCELIKRNKTRAVEDMENFLDTGEIAPRLPDITQKTYKKDVELIQDVFYRIISNCGDTYKEEFCKYPIRFMVVDNRRKDNTNPVIYDSQFAKDKERLQREKPGEYTHKLYNNAAELRKIFATPSNCASRLNNLVVPDILPHSSAGGRKRKTKRKKRICCVGCGCPDYRHCINVLGLKSENIRPKSKKTLKRMKKCEIKTDKIFNKCLRKKKNKKKHTICSRQRQKKYKKCMKKTRKYKKN